MCHSQGRRVHNRYILEECLTRLQLSKHVVQMHSMLRPCRGHAMARKHVRKAAECEYAYSCGSTHVIALHCIVRICHKSVQERRSWLGRKDLQEVEAPPTLLTGPHLVQVFRGSSIHKVHAKKKKIQQTGLDTNIS